MNKIGWITLFSIILISIPLLIVNKINEKRKNYFLSMMLTTSYELEIYKKENCYNFPDRKEWNKIKHKLENEYKNGINLFYCDNVKPNEFATQIIVWCIFNDYIYYIKSSPGFTKNRYLFNYKKGDLPDYFYFLKSGSNEDKIKEILQGYGREQTLLLLYTMFNETKKAKNLVKSQIDINKQDPNGITPLMWAVSNGNIELVGSLLQNGANPYLQNIFGDTAFDIARKKKNNKIERLLKNYRK